MCCKPLCSWLHWGCYCCRAIASPYVCEGMLRRSNDVERILSLTFLVGLIAATLRVATPLVFATIGEVFTERAGILNLGIEGTMFLGAFVGFAVAYKAHEAGLAAYLWIGLLCAILIGVLMGLLMGLFSVRLGVNQHVSGLGITLLCTGLSLLGFRMVFGERSVLPSID